MFSFILSDRFYGNRNLPNKKMSFPENLQVGFLPAHLVERGNDCLVCYAVRTAAGKYDYRRISVKKYKRTLSGEQFLAYVDNLCHEINLRLIGVSSVGASAG